MIRETENGHEWHVDSDYDIEICVPDFHGEEVPTWITEEELLQMLVEIQKERCRRDRS